MPYWKCKGCHHEWESAEERHCSWCGSEGFILEEETPFETFVRKCQECGWDIREAFGIAGNGVAEELLEQYPSRAEVEKLRVALEKYGRHLAYCLGSGRCTCGLEQALKGEE